MGPECALKNNRCFLKSTPCSPSTESYTCTYCTNSKSNAVQRIVLFQHFRWFTWSSILPMPRPYGMPKNHWLSGRPVVYRYLVHTQVVLGRPKNTQVELSIHRQPSSVHYIEIQNLLTMIEQRELAGVTLYPSFRHFFRDSTRQTGTAFARLP